MISKLMNYYHSMILLGIRWLTECDRVNSKKKNLLLNRVVNTSNWIF